MKQRPRAAGLRYAELAMILAGTMLMGTSALGGIFSGARPENLGLHDGRLSACPDKPNCVSSQAADPRHAIAPLPFSGSPDAAMQTLAKILEAMERTTIIVQQANYLYAEFTSRVMGFVDDVEFALDRSAKTIHVRSASRLGYGDFGVNRKRVEAIRQAFAGHNL